MWFLLRAFENFVARSGRTLGRRTAKSLSMIQCVLPMNFGFRLRIHEGSVGWPGGRGMPALRFERSGGFAGTQSTRWPTRLPPPTIRLSLLFQFGLFECGDMLYSLRLPWWS